ncbi:VanZ like protein [Winogradskyella epiphytica]|uniref:VanZ like protein n=1 Tax=Winogradskyella epiphytica TaxID=262005 RepID=A0A2V4XC66_9FLAO|nr:VanZ family protein [Winogradskyella epiphytica]PYE83625.1 VanZ like protein [Winogradskyella epiphytica]
MLLLVSVVYTLALVIASLITLNGVPSLGSSFDDKIFHVVAYIGLSFLWVYYFKPFKTKQIPYIVFFVVVLLGFILELLQYYVNPNRTYDTYDFIANTIGAIFGTFIAIQLNVFKLK